MSRCRCCSFIPIIFLLVLRYNVGAVILQSLQVVAQYCIYKTSFRNMLIKLTWFTLSECGYFICSAFGPNWLFTNLTAQAYVACSEGEVYYNFIIFLNELTVGGFALYTGSVILNYVREHMPAANDANNATFIGELTDNIIPGPFAPLRARYVPMV